MHFYALNEFPGDGVTTEWDFFFDGVSPDNSSGTTPYLYPEDIRVSQETMDEFGNVTSVPRTSVLLSANRVRVLGAPVPVGSTVRIVRSTEARFPLVDYRDRQTVTESDLDLQSRQALFVAAEAFDRASQTVVVTDRAVQDIRDTASAALQVANGVDAKATQALVNSVTAVTTANTSLQVANGVDAKATQAQQDAATALQVANGVDAKATQAQQDAGEARAAVESILEQGAETLPHNAVQVESVHSLLSKVGDGSQAYVVLSYFPGKDLGGGVFRWSPTTPRTLHDGGRVLSPTVPWDGSRATLGAFLRGEGESADGGAVGCFLRVEKGFRVVDYGAVLGAEEDSSSSWRQALVKACSQHQELVLPDGLIRVDSPAVLVGSALGFCTVKVRGTFRTNANALGYVPERCGSVIFTRGNPAIDVTLDVFSAENLDFRGVGFCDVSHYPAQAPMAEVSAVVVRKGRPDGQSYRYNSNNAMIDVAFVGYRECILVIGQTLASVPSALGLNYVGPTTLKRVSVSKCGDFIVLRDSSMNHLWISEFVLHGLEGYGVRLEKTPTGTGGNVNVIYRSGVFEHMRGPLNSAGGFVGQSSPGVLARNRLVLDGTNREFTGSFGPSATAPYFFSGNPLGYVGNTDVVISGLWTRGVAYGEQTAPRLEAGSTISADVDVQVYLDAPDVRVLTPDTVNREAASLSLGSGQSTTVTVVSRSPGRYDMTCHLVFAEGAYGWQDVSFVGNKGQTTQWRTLSGSKEAAIGVSAATGSGENLTVITITNNSPFTIIVDGTLTCRRGAGALA